MYVHNQLQRQLYLYWSGSSSLGVWPDWAVFRLLVDFVPCAVFKKISGLLFERLKLCICLDTKSYIHFGRFFHQSIGSPRSLTHVCLCMPTYVCLCMPMYAYVCICMPMYVYVCLCMHMYAYVCLCMPMYAYVCLCMPMYAYVCIIVMRNMKIGYFIPIQIAAIYFTRSKSPKTIPNFFGENIFKKSYHVHDFFLGLKWRKKRSGGALKL
jgi:hypothetical protein